MIRRSIHTGIRLRPDLQATIQEEVNAANGAIDVTEALHRLARRGAGKQHVYYLASNISARKDLEFFSQQLHELLPRLDMIKSRLAGPLRPIMNDPERTQNIENWRKLAQDLLPAFRNLFDVANSLSEVMTGLTAAEITEIKETGLQLDEWLPPRRKRLIEAQEKGDSERIKFETKIIRGYEAYLKVTARLLGSNYSAGLRSDAGS